MIEARASARYVRTSAQKAGLVLDQIRGRDVNQALAALRYSRKGVARDVEKVLRSAIANAQQQEGFGGDVDRLYVLSAYADQGPSQKRVRPAPMGRAFRVVKRTAHLTVRVAERALEIAAVTQPPVRVPDAGATPAEGAQAKPATASRPSRKPRARAKAKTKGKGKAKAAARAKAHGKRGASTRAKAPARRATTKTKKGQ
jgi:large subunit ribosomal protein L22